MKQASVVKKTAAKSSAAKTNTVTSAAKPKSNGNLTQKVQEKAYQLYVERGCIHGYADQDWIKAEKIVKGS